MSFVITKEEQKNIEELCKDHKKTLGEVITDYIRIGSWYMKKKGYEPQAIALHTEDYMKVTSIQDNYYDLITKHQSRDYLKMRNHNSKQFYMDWQDIGLQYSNKAFNIIDRHCDIYGKKK